MPGTIRPPSSADLGTASSPNVSVAATYHATSSPSLLSGNRSDTRMPRVCPVCGVRYPAEFKVCPRDATELSDVSDQEKDALVGTTLSATYSIVRVIGEGGMGRVYEARHTRIASKRFAIKMLHPEFARQSEVISRFQREAEAAAAIESAHVVGVYDVDRTEDGRPFLVAEYLEGKELGDRIQENGPMDIGGAVRVVRQICKALEAAHERGVVHRDMKPENVFLTGDLGRPTAKVIDFGISKIGDAPGTALTKTGMIMGTPAYMAPEQARGEHVDLRADIYAVGAILYCAITGKRPFDRGDPTATLMAVLTEDPARPRTLNPDIPEALEVVIQRAMAKMPADRYQTMGELDIALADFDSTGGRGSPSMSAGLAPRKPTGLDRQTREVSMARPSIVLASMLGLVWLLAGVITTIAAFVRMSRGGGATANLTASEAVLLTLGLALALLTPAVLGINHIRKLVWANSMKSLELAEKLKHPVVFALGAYGFASLLVRFVEAIVLRRAAGVAWPVWDALLFLIGAVAAGAALLTAKK